MRILDRHKLNESAIAANAESYSSCEHLGLIDSSFGVPFSVFDCDCGEIVHAGLGLPTFDVSEFAPLCREISRRGNAELVVEAGPFAILAIPLPANDDRACLAIAPFVNGSLTPNDKLSAALAALGMNGKIGLEWAVEQLAWSPETLLRMASTVQKQLQSAQRICRLERDVQSISANINDTYEEISLLHRLTENLKLSRSSEELGRIALEWLHEVIPAAVVALQIPPFGQKQMADADRILLPLYLASGDLSFSSTAFARLAEHASRMPNASGLPLVLNSGATSQADWPFPDIRQAIFVPLVEGSHHFGWMAALNHIDGGEFGTVEANLMNSVAVILGTHSGNMLLYQQQAELTTGIIRALTEAIDAKDQYTCGHSDRVARIAVRIAREMNCDLPTVNTIYLAGLLHDVGKIGIDDTVLRKPDRLTPEEFEHIKSHPGIGHRILRDIKKLDTILPIILHHHEAWNGKGYPMQLAAENIPLAARIIAVADSYDAMGSDRPYRKGMPEAKIDEIFRKESGVQWDPEVVAAYFRAKDDVRLIVNDKRSDLQLDKMQWAR